MRHLLLLGALVCCCLALADDLQAPPFTPSPVTEWGKPLDGGPIHSLFILQGAKQEALEFMRRFDVQGTVLVSASGGKYGLGATEASIARRVLATDTPDVCVIGGIFWKRLPAPVRLAILEKVQQGMGLLYVDAPNSAMDTTLPKVMAADPAPEAAAAVCNGIPIPLLPLVTIDPEGNAYTMYPDAQHPAPTPEQLVTGARFGKGRICLLHYSVGQSNVVYLYSLTPGLKTQDMPFARDYPYWEYCHALLGKAVRWAARREPNVTLKVEAKPEGLSLGTVTVEGAGPTPDKIEWEVWDKYHLSFTGQGLGPARPGRYPVTLSAQQLPEGGTYFIEARLTRGGKVVDWATAAGEMPSSAKVTVSLYKDRYAADEPVTGNAVVEGVRPEPRDAGPEPEPTNVLWASLKATDGRLLGFQAYPVKPGGKPIYLQFSLQGAQTLVSYLDVWLSQNHRTTCRERVPVFLAPGAPREFFAYSWMQGETYYQRDYLRRIQDQGVDAVTAGGGAATYFCEGSRLASEMNLRCVPTNVVDSRPQVEPGTFNLKRPLTDPKVIAEEDQRIFENVPRTAVLDPIGYSLMDEWTLGAPQVPADYGPSAVAAFRKWLPAKYADIAALNAEWGTQYTSFDEAQPAQVDELRKGLPASPDLSKLNLSRFVDYRLFLDTVGPTGFAHFADSIRKLDPGAKVGLCGTESASTWFGHDWWALSQALNFICGYGDATAVPNIANFRGLQRELQRSFRTPGSLLACWVGYGESEFYRDQALKLLLHDFQGIAYFSGEPMAYQDFPYLDYDFTLSHRALLAGACTSELRRGLDQLFWNSRRDNSGLAILLSQPSLHVASALGQDGAWGDRCVDLTRAVEDAGFQYDFVAPAQLADGVLKQRGYKVLLLPGATSLSDAEVAAVNEFGRAGGQVLFDQRPAVMDEHGKARPQPVLTAVKALAALTADRAKNASAMGEALAAADLKPLATVQHGEKAFLPTEITLYHNGDQQFVSVQTDVMEWSQPKPQATVNLPAEACVYDMREGKFLGKTRQVQATLDPMHILLYALLPYEVKAVAVKPVAPAVRAGDTATVRLSVIPSAGKAGTHFLRVTLVGPDGKDRPGFATTIKSENGTAEAVLRFALNDPVGKWTITARDAATGVTGSATLEVRP